MQRLFSTLNLLVLYCLWYLHNLFRKRNQGELENIFPVENTINTPVNNDNDGQYMRFTSVTYIGHPKKILCSTYIYKIIDSSKLNILTPTLAEENSSIFCSDYMKSVKCDSFSTMINKKDYTRLWLDSLMAITEQ